MTVSLIGNREWIQCFHHLSVFHFTAQRTCVAMFSHRYMNCTDLILIIFRPSPEFEDCSIIEIAISLD